MTKFNFILAGTVAMATLSTPVFAAPQGQFPDVQPTNWAYQAILNLRDRYGVVAGYPDGTFRAGKPATRAELAALVNASLDQITTYMDSKDAALAAALRAEVAGVSTRVTRLEVASERKAQGVGEYLGAGVLLNRQGVAGNDYSPNRTVAGATIQGRFPVTTLWGNEVSLRPYVNLVAGPTGNIGAGGGALATYDYSLARKSLADGTKVSTANLYGGVGYQIPFVNGTLANYQAAVGDRGQAVFVLGAEGRLTNSLVAFTDAKFPTTSSGVVYGDNRGYSPVFTAGLGFKF